MIFSKANLLAVAAVGKKAARRALRGVFMEKDGATVATDGSRLLAVGPIMDPEKVRFPDGACERLNPGTNGILCPNEFVEKAIKYIPPKGYQFVALSKPADEARIGLTAVDANGDASMVTAKPMPEPFPNWRSAVKQVYDGVTTQICLDSNYLESIVKAVRDASNAKSKGIPLYVEINPEMGIVIRTRNINTGQEVIGLLMKYQTNEWLQKTDWERKVFRKPVKLRKSSR